MRKLFLTLMIALVVGFTAMAQTTETISVGKSDMYVEVDALSTDIVDATGETVGKIFDLSKKNSFIYYTFAFDVDTVSHEAVLNTHEVPITLHTSYDQITWTAVDSVDYMATADTAFTFQDITTGTDVPYMKVTMEGVDSVSVQLMSLKARFLGVYYK